jgi:hypothetical protein
VRCREPWNQRQQAVQTERDVAIDPHQSAWDSSGSNRPFGLIQVGQDTVRSLEKGLTLGGKQQLIRIRLKKHPLTGSDRCDPRSVGNEPVPCIAAGANDLFV